MRAEALWEDISHQEGGHTSGAAPLIPLATRSASCAVRDASVEERDLEGSAAQLESFSFDAAETHLVTKS